MLLVSRYVTGFSLCYWFLGYVYLCCFMDSLGVCIVCLSLFIQIYYTMMGRTGCGRSLLTKSDSG